jgi:hypothetical protein
LAAVGFAHFCFAVAKVAAEHVVAREFSDPLVLGSGVCGFDVAGKDVSSGFREGGGVGWLALVSSAALA